MTKKAFISVFFILAIEGIDLSTLSIALSIIMDEFRLDPVHGGMLFSFSTAGMMVGGILSGWLSDRIGRLRVTQAATLLFTVFICLSTVTDDFIVFSLIRFVSSAGMAGAWSGGVVMVSEYTPTEKRNTMLGIIQGGNTCGAIVASILNGIITPVYGWRPVVLTSVVCGIIALAFTRKLKEPPSFRAYKQQKKRKKDRNEASGIIMLMRDKSCRNNLVKWMAASILLMGGYYAANSWLPTYMTEEYGISFKSMTYFIAGNYTMMFIGRTSAGILSDRFGRKKIWFTACVATAVVLPVVIFMATEENVGFLMLFFGLFYGAPMALCSTFMSESFPTACRGTGTALAYNGGRIGSMLSTVMIGGLASGSGSYAAGFLLIAVAYLACGLVIFLIRERQFDPEEIPEAKSR